MQSAPMRRLMNGFNTVSSQSHCCIFAINSSDSCGTFQHLEILKVSWQKKNNKVYFCVRDQFQWHVWLLCDTKYSVKVLFCMQHARERGVNIELQLRWFLLMVKRIKYWYSLLFDNNSTNKFSFCFMCYSYITGFPSYVGTEFIDLGWACKAIQETIYHRSCCVSFVQYN